MYVCLADDGPRGPAVEAPRLGAEETPGWLKIR